jgi:putative ABC transport system ATP-binding protein
VKEARTREPSDDGADGAPSILVARGVSKAYRVGESEIAALRGVDLEVARGSFVSVVGPSGSGKTTLLHCLSGIDTIDSGTVEIEGEDLHRLPEAKRAAQRARLMGFVFQSLNLLPILSVLENVELPLILQRRPLKEARGTALLALERVGLSHRVGHRPGELSGGEQQRAAVARALAGSPAIVWADEPTGNLDSASAAALVDLLAELNAGGLTLMLVTHDAAVAARAERRISMRDGRIVEDTAG